MQKQTIDCSRLKFLVSHAEGNSSALNLSGIPMSVLGVFYGFPGKNGFSYPLFARSLCILNLAVMKHFLKFCRCKFCCLLFWHFIFGLDIALI